MRNLVSRFWLLLLVASVPRLAAAHDPAAIEFFEKKVRPLLVANCNNCHSADNNSQGGLRVDDRNGLILGGGRGAAVVPGDPEKSLLINAVRYQDDLKMPPKKQLTAEEVADLEKWIADGAAWPVAELPASIGQYTAEYEKLRKEHWAWQPLTQVPPPCGPGYRLAPGRHRPIHPGAT